jgi:hypothetical protein
MHIVQQAILLELLHKIEHRLVQITERESWKKIMPNAMKSREWMGMAFVAPMLRTIGWTKTNRLLDWTLAYFRF